VELIKSKLEKNRYVTVTIDAWRYSSAENLRRAFLVHVANDLAPTLLDELRRKLYTTEQETLPNTTSKLDKTKTLVWEQISRVICQFSLSIMAFLIIFWSFYSIDILINGPANSNYFDKANWQGFRLRNLFSVNSSQNYPMFFNKRTTCLSNSVCRFATPRWFPSTARKPIAGMKPHLEKHPPPGCVYGSLC